MKYLIVFEKFDKIGVGDYVLMKPPFYSYVENEIMNNIKDFLENTIGIVVELNININISDISVKYEYVPKNIEHYFLKKGRVFYRWFDISRIVEYGKTIEELKMKKETKKFNL